jgi:hypothetical protein
MIRGASPLYLSIAFPGIFLLVFSFFGSRQPYEWTPIALGALIPWLLILAAAFFSNSLGNGWRDLLGLVVLTYVYGAAAIIVLNMGLDPSSSANYTARIESKSTTYGRHRSYNLHIGPWGPQPEPSTISVDNALYSAVEPGGRVCLELHTGALHIRWFRATLCR